MSDDVRVRVGPHRFSSNPAAMIAFLELLGMSPVPDFAADERFFAGLGFTSDSPGDEWWQALSAGEDSGQVGLHQPSGEPVQVHQA